MNGVQLSIAESTLAGFVLALARTGGFVLVAPPFNSRSVPAQARVALAVALALPLSIVVQPVAPALDSTALVVQVVLQVVTGAALGYLILVAVAAIQAAGDLIDAVGGFSAATAMDPMLFTQTSIMGRLHQMTAVAVLFVSDGHLVVLQGLARSVELMPLPALSPEVFAETIVRDLASMFVAALQIAAPLMAAMLIADVALGLLNRVAPALQAFALGFPLKILFTLLLAGLVLARVPDALGRLVQDAAMMIIELSTPAGDSGSAGG